jgi:hypothetical protein
VLSRKDRHVPTDIDVVAKRDAATSVEKTRVANDAIRTNDDPFGRVELGSPMNAAGPGQH